MKELLKLGNSIFFALAVLWLYFSFYFGFQYLNIDFTNLTRQLANILVILFLMSIVIFHYKERALKFIRWLYAQFVSHKIISLIVLALFQVVILITSVGLASADTAIVYRIATDSKFAATTQYVSNNPNNYLLVLWFKVNYLVFRENLVVSLAFWNVLFIDCSIYLLFKVNEIFTNSKISDIVFSLSYLILGLSPQYIYTYSDPITLFLLTLLLYLFGKVIKDFNAGQVSRILTIILGLLLAVTYGFRPTIMIFIISLAIVSILWTIKNLHQKRKLVELFKIILIFSISFLLLNRVLSFSLNHQKIVNYEPKMSRTLTYYVDLGLTYTGNNHAELSKEVVASRGKERNSLALMDAKAKLKNYTYTTFIGHLFYKYYWMIGEGNFGWFQERVLSEEQLLNNKWLSNIQKTSLAKKIRNYIYVGGEKYYLFGIIIQLIWIVVVVGVTLFPLYFNPSNFYQLWMQITIFGGLLFLMIFEAGRSRYLIQFSPAILTISSLGYYYCMQSKYGDKV